MATRLNKRQADTTRSHIQANRIVEELQKYFHGESEKTAGQLRAAEILLSKSLPNLQAVDLSADVQGDIQVNIGSFIPPDAD